MKSKTVEEGKKIEKFELTCETGNNIVMFNDIVIANLNKISDKLNEIINIINTFKEGDKE